MANKKKFHGEDFNNYPLVGLPTPTTAETTAAANVQFVLDNAGGAPTATNVSFTPDADTFPEGTDNVDVALKHLFTSANSGKDNVADSIGYDVSTSSYSGTFATLAEHIDTTKDALEDFLPKAERTLTGDEKLHELGADLNNVRIFKQRVDLIKKAGSTTQVQLKQPYPPLDKLVVCPFVRVNDTAQTEVVASFDNGEQNDFFTNEYILFDGVAKLKNNYTYTATDVGSGILEWTINASQFEEFKELSISSTTLSLVARTKPQVLEANDDIEFENVIDISRIARYIGPTNSGFQYWAVSFDSGTRWFGNKTNVVGGWQQVNISDVNDFISKGTSVTAHGNDVVNEIRTLNDNNPNTVRFAYLLRDTSYTQKNTVDKLEIDLIFSGVFKPYSFAGVPSNTFDYDANTGVVTVNHDQDDAYIINYIDKP